MTFSESSWRTCTICTLCFVVWQRNHVVDMSTNWWQGFIWVCTASTEQAADGAEVVDQLPTDNMSVSVCLQTPGDRLMMVFWCTVSLPVVGTIKNDSNSYSNDALYLVLVLGSVSSGLALTLSIYHGPLLCFARWIFNLLPDILREPVIIISRVLQSL